MFGKGKSKMSGNDRFVMAAGRKVGNLKGTNVGNTKGGKGGEKGKAGPNPFRSKDVSLGQVNTFKTRGK